MTLPELLQDYYDVIDQYVITRSELDILKCIERRITKVRDIAETLCRSPRTIENQLQSIYRKLGVKDKETLLIKILKDEFNEQETIAVRF